MSWLFSQALVEACSPATFLDGEPSAQLSVMPTPHKFWRNDKTMEPCDLSQFGLTCRLLTADRGAAVLMSFLADFPAKTSAPQAVVPGSTENAQGSGVSSLGSFARYDQAASMWKTAQCSLLGDSESFSETWPRWGSMRSGASYLRPIPALPICASVSGLWPTPTVNGNHNQPGASASAGWGLSSAAKLWQTPVADDAVNRATGKWNSRGKPKLSAEVMLFPTPMTRGLDGGSNSRKARKNWPTPVASASKGSSPASLVRKSGKSRENDRLDHAVMASDGGQLNPTWVEWLMGWPTGWTELKPLEMDRFHEWLQQHGGF